MSDRRLATEADLIRHLDEINRRALDARSAKRDWLLLQQKGGEKTFSAREVMRVVENATGVCADSIRLHRRAPHIIRARFIFYYVASKVTGRSISAIARYIDRDHSTIIKCLKVVEAKRQKYEPELSQILAYFGKSKVVETGGNSAYGKPNHASGSM